MYGRLPRTNGSTEALSGMQTSVFAVMVNEGESASGRPRQVVVWVLPEVLSFGEAGKAGLPFASTT